VRGYYQRITDMLDLDRMGERLPGPPVRGFFPRYGQIIKRALLFGFISLAVLLLILFAGDYARIRYRMAAHNHPFDSLTVRPYYAVRLKSGKTEFMFQDPVSETCLNSLFPHFGMTPCWYARRHLEKRTDM